MRSVVLSYGIFCAVVDVEEMTMLIRRISLFTGALLVAAGPALAQDHAAHHKQDKLMKGSPIALEGCVISGENTDTFVVTKMKQIPDRPAESGRIFIYKLDKIGKFRGFVGQLVRIDGEVDGIEEGEIDPRAREAGSGGTLVELEVPGRDVDTTAAVIRESVKGTSGTDKVKTTVIDVDVDNVTPVRPCGT